MGKKRSPGGYYAVCYEADRFSGFIYTRNIPMRAYHLDYLGSLDGMTLHEQDIPKAGPNEVLVKVHAASLNQRDLMIIAGTYPFPAKPGVIPVSDGAGEVVAVGDGVTRFAVGDRVCTTYLLGWLDGPLKTGFTGRQLGTSDDGILAEYSVLHEDWLVGIPDSCPSRKLQLCRVRR